MNLYEKLPVELLFRFYNEVKNNIDKGILTKKMYYELGLIIAAAYRRGITLDFPPDFKEEVNEEALRDLLNAEQLVVG